MINQGSKTVETLTFNCFVFILLSEVEIEVAIITIKDMPIAWCILNSVKKVSPGTRIMAPPRPNKLPKIPAIIPNKKNKITGSTNSKIIFYSWKNLPSR